MAAGIDVEAGFTGSDVGIALLGAEVAVPEVEGEDTVPGNGATEGGTRGVSDTGGTGAVGVPDLGPAGWALVD